MHHWLSINTLTVVHYATLETIAEQDGRNPKLYIFGRPLLPTVSFGGLLAALAASGSALA